MNLQRKEASVIHSNYLHYWFADVCNEFENMLEREKNICSDQISTGCTAEAGAAIVEASSATTKGAPIRISGDDQPTPKWSVNFKKQNWEKVDRTPNWSVSAVSVFVLRYLWTEVTPPPPGHCSYIVTLISDRSLAKRCSHKCSENSKLKYFERYLARCIYCELVVLAH